jgi:hypothetical protein
MKLNPSRFSFGLLLVNNPGRDLTSLYFPNRSERKFFSSAEAQKANLKGDSFKPAVV